MYIAYTCDLYDLPHLILQKLRLFDPDDGCLLPVETTLEALMGDSGVVISGGTLILEYVADDVTQLPDLDSYQL